LPVMAGSLSAADRQRLALLETIDGKVQQLHGLVERFAVAGDDVLVQPIRRLFTQLKRECTGAGMDSMAQQCGALDMAARRGGSRTMKLRILREGVGSLRHQVELQQRAIRSEAKDRAVREARNEAATPPPPEAP
jgi:hypothetical protein